MKAMINSDPVVVSVDVLMVSHFYRNHRWERLSWGRYRYDTYLTCLAHSSRKKEMVIWALNTPKTHKFLCGVTRMRKSYHEKHLMRMWCFSFFGLGADSADTTNQPGQLVMSVFCVCVCVCVIMDLNMNHSNEQCLVVVNTQNTFHSDSWLLRTTDKL